MPVLDGISAPLRADPARVSVSTAPRVASCRRSTPTTTSAASLRAGASGFLLKDGSPSRARRGGPGGGRGRGAAGAVGHPSGDRAVVATSRRRPGKNPRLAKLTTRNTSAPARRPRGRSNQRWEQRWCSPSRQLKPRQPDLEQLSCSSSWRWPPGGPVPGHRVARLSREWDPSVRRKPRSLSELMYATACSLSSAACSRPTRSSRGGPAPRRPSRIDERAPRTPAGLRKLADRAGLFHHRDHAADRIVRAVHPRVVVVAADDPLVGQLRPRIRAITS